MNQNNPTIKLFNTLTRKPDKLKPMTSGQVLMYVCGPTVYDFDHFGHARTFVVFDSLRRFLEFVGFKSKMVQNITDVGHLTADEERGDDKVEQKAKKEGKSPEQIARFFEKAHFEDMAALNVKKPDISPRATEHIPNIIELISKLIEKDFAYQVSGNVYFNVTKFKRYGKLSRRTLTELNQNSRVKQDSNKRHPADFILWNRGNPEHLQKWASPWGEGFPGWHIECSAMSTKYLGQPFDIHGSANEHIFPHHENEIAQSEAAENKPLAKMFLHSGMVTTGGEKMSKSKGNSLTIRYLLERYDADTIRVAILSTYWRKPLDITDGKLIQARTAVRQLKKTGESSVGSQEIFQKIIQYLADDFNTVAALNLWQKTKGELSAGQNHDLKAIFGLKLEPIRKIKLTQEQEELIEKREKLRKAGDFRKADEIRKALEKQGLKLEDTEQGTEVAG